jgi:hypothetical protein
MMSGVASPAAQICGRDQHAIVALRRRRGVLVVGPLDLDLVADPRDAHDLRAALHGHAHLAEALGDDVRDVFIFERQDARLAIE